MRKPFVLFLAAISSVVLAQVPQYEIARAWRVLAYPEFWPTGINDDLSLRGRVEWKTGQPPPFDYARIGAIEKDRQLRLYYGFGSRPTGVGNPNRFGVVPGGAFYESKDEAVACLWHPDGRFQVLGHLYRDWSSGALEINDSNWVMGSGFTPQGRRTFIWRDGVMMDIGTIGLGGDNNAEALTNSGMIVGNEYAGESRIQGYYWTEATGIVPLPGTVADANNHDQILGIFDGVGLGIWQNGLVRKLPIGRRREIWPSFINDHADVLVGFRNGLHVYFRGKGAPVPVTALLEKSDRFRFDWTPDGLGPNGEILTRATEVATNRVWMLYLVPKR